VSSVAALPVSDLSGVALGVALASSFVVLLEFPVELCEIVESLLVVDVSFLIFVSAAGFVSSDDDEDDDGEEELGSDCCTLGVSLDASSARAIHKGNNMG